MFRFSEYHYTKRSARMFSICFFFTVLYVIHSMIQTTKQFHFGCQYFEQENHAVFVNRTGVHTYGTCTVTVSSAVSPCKSRLNSLKSNWTHTIRYDTIRRTMERWTNTNQTKTKMAVSNVKKCIHIYIYMKVIY